MDGGVVGGGVWKVTMLFWPPRHQNQVCLQLLLTETFSTFWPDGITPAHHLTGFVLPTFRKIMLVKSDKTAFVLIPRSSEKWSFSPLKGGMEEKQSRSPLDSRFVLSPKWRLDVWLRRLLICRQYLKVAHVSDFHGHPTKGEQIADKGVPFLFSSVVRTTKKYFSDKFYFKAFLVEGWLLHSFY